MSKENYLQVPTYDNPFLFEKLDSYQKMLAKKMREDGFIILEFPDKELIYKSKIIQNEINSDKFQNHTESRNDSKDRLQDAFEIKEINEIAINEDIIKLLTNLYGKKAFPFQTLTFKRGTEQEAHSDHVHFNSLPQRFMAGVWVALEDVDGENGPLFYYPGSHKWPFLNNMLIDVQIRSHKDARYHKYLDTFKGYADLYDVSPKEVHLKAGQCIIWSSNLVHGGSKQNDLGRSRWSQVTHYFFENCMYYTPLYSNEELASYDLRKPSNISSGEVSKNIIFGKEFDLTSQFDLKLYKKRGIANHSFHEILRRIKKIMKNIRY